MLVDLTKKELDEIVDALCCEHWDWNKRDYRSQLHQKMKNLQNVCTCKENKLLKKTQKQDSGDTHNQCREIP